MPESITSPTRACDWSRQLGELTIQAQGRAFTIENLLETDFQSPHSQTRILTKLRELQKLLLDIQLKNHFVSTELGNQRNLSACNTGAQIE